MNLRKIIKTIVITFGIIAFLIPYSCEDTKKCPRIETGPVDITIFPNSTEYQELNVIGGWVHLTSRPPSKGIIVYRSSQDEFMAYERSCPYHPENPDARVTVDEDFGNIAKDTVCGSLFILTDGYPIDGPASCPLTQYNTSYDGVRLRIFY